MKRVKVSAFRERGLRPDECREAEPQVWSIKNSNFERKADTMKTYILRNSPTVDARKKTGLVLSPTPAPAAVGNATDPVLYIGLDVHNDTIAVSIAPSDST